MLKNLKIRGKLLIGFLVPVLVLGFFGGYVVISENEIGRNTTMIGEIFEEELVQDTIPQLVSSLQMKVAIFETLTEVNDYILTGESDDKEEFEAARERFEEIEDVYAAVVAAGEKSDERDREQEFILEREMLEDEMDTSIDELVVLFESGASRAEILDKKEELEVNADKVVVLLDRIIKLEVDEVTEEEEELTLLIQNVQKNIKTVEVIFVVILIMGILASLFVALSIANIVAKSIQKVRNVAVEVAKGNMDAEVDTSGKDEIAELAQAVEKMRLSLIKSFNILEEKVQERTTELENAKKLLSGKVTEGEEKLKKRVEELEDMNRLMVGREIKMVELKEEIEEQKMEKEN
ncbi:hypothetical protein COB52_03245 [Candidatus Kaiserbacteria bacterium]|nr:MAG: hypothetical protein COB52_03245 [Candidatus Kaiserbacteria bacterium]